MHPGQSLRTWFLLVVMLMLTLVFHQRVDGHTSLISPNGGESLTAGDLFTIEWIVDIPHNLQDWDLWYSVSSAEGPWIDIATDIPAGNPDKGSQHFFSWTVPSVDADQAWARVRMDNAGDDYYDVSDLPFSIQVMTAACDFNGNGTCHLDDLNAMLAEGPVSSGVPVVAGVNNQFDLDGDGTLDLVDVDQWLTEAAAQNGLPSPYREGDADLNGVVDGEDFLDWNAHKFTNTLRWDQGDFNGDGVADGSDFLLWNSSKFQASDTAVVAEPSGSLVLIVTLLLHAGCRLSRSRLAQSE